MFAQLELNDAPANPGRDGEMDPFIGESERLPAVVFDRLVCDGFPLQLRAADESRAENRCNEEESDPDQLSLRCCFHLQRFGALTLKEKLRTRSSSRGSKGVPSGRNILFGRGHLDHQAESRVLYQTSDWIRPDCLPSSVCSPREIVSVRRLFRASKRGQPAAMRTCVAASNPRAFLQSRPASADLL
jgi:hypothetical protein